MRSTLRLAISGMRKRGPKEGPVAGTAKEQTPSLKACPTENAQRRRWRPCPPSSSFDAAGASAKKNRQLTARRGRRSAASVLRLDRLTSKPAMSGRT